MRKLLVFIYSIKKTYANCPVQFNVNMCNLVLNNGVNVRITYYLGTFLKLLLLWKSSNYYTFLCVCARASLRVLGCGCAGVCLCACSLSSPAFKRSPYCLRPVRLHHIFRHHINGTIFGRMLLIIRCVFSFSPKLLF